MGLPNGYLFPPQSRIEVSGQYGLRLRWKRNFSVRYGASIPDSDGRSRRASGSPGTKRIDFDFDFEPEKKETQTRSEPKPVSSDLGERNPNRNRNRE